jgi:hypothetical protein
VGEQKLSERLKTSLDELRMQVLGAQVLFGFQYQSLFQDSFERATPAEQIADGGSLAAIVFAFAMLISPPAEHRCIAILLWFGIGMSMRSGQRPELAEREMTDLHTKIDQMLTESRVILPGVQAMLGFQLIVFMSRAFERLPRALQVLHLGGLACSVAAMSLLIAPAAVHRLAFNGNDDPRFHRVGTHFLNVALFPLAVAIAAESFIAAWQLTKTTVIAATASLIVFSLLIGMWYVVPLSTRAPR